MFELITSQTARPQSHCAVPGPLLIPRLNGPSNMLQVVHWRLVWMAGGCRGWSKERSPSGRMKDLDLKGRGCTHQAGPPLSSGLTHVAPSSMALIILCIIIHSLSSLCLLWSAPLPFSCFLLSYLPPSPHNSKSNINKYRKENKLFLKFCSFFPLIFIFQPPAPI